MFTAYVECICLPMMFLLPTPCSVSFLIEDNTCYAYMLIYCYYEDLYLCLSVYNMCACLYIHLWYSMADYIHDSYCLCYLQWIMCAH